MKKQPDKKQIAAFNKLNLREQISYISEKYDRREPNFGNLDQQWSDEAYTQDWANGMHRRDSSIQICEIRSNPNDPPDCFAKMNGKCVAVEVTKLVEKQGYEDWPLKKFKESLKQIVKKKDEITGRDDSLHKQFLLIPVGTEIHLGESVLKEYLKKITLPRPKNFDAVYVMGAQVPRDTGEGPHSHPVFEVCLST